MNKLWFLIFLVGGFSLTLSAQTEFQFVFGGSLPMGKFGANDLDGGGYAREGIYLKAEFAHHLNQKNYGLLGFVSFLTQDIDNNGLEDDYFSELPEIIESISVEPSNYRSILLMAGPFYDLSLSEGLDIRIKAGAGLFSATLEDQSLLARLVTEDGERTVLVTSEAEGSARFSYFLGADLIYQLSPRFGLKFDLLFSSANPEISLESLEEAGQRREAEQRMSMLNGGIGIIFSFP